MDSKLKHILELRDEVLKSLDGKVDDFLLGGGTALSLFYLKHRESFDLDFFTRDFSHRKIKTVVSEIENAQGVKIISRDPASLENSAQIVRCFVPVNDRKELDLTEDNNSFKIDFIEDVHSDVPSKKVVIDGVPILSIENIYLRKIYAVCGVLERKDVLGRKRFVGGRQEAKDLFDLFYLSKDFMPLSKFIEEYCPEEKVKAITWYGSYKREEMKLGINELIILKPVDFHVIERHFKKEIENMIKPEL